jgi:micrococcal nuclease
MLLMVLRSIYKNKHTIDKEILTIRLVLVDALRFMKKVIQKPKNLFQNCLDKLAVVDPDNNQEFSYGRLVALVYCQCLNINEAAIQSGLTSICQFFFDIQIW